MTKAEKAKKAAYARARYRANPTRSAAQSRAWRKANPERSVELGRASKLRRHYDISLKQRDAMHSAQQGRCAICGNEIAQRGGATHVDHDHATGKVRALLCRTCNGGLGLFKDSEANLRPASDYLKFHTRPT